MPIFKRDYSFDVKRFRDQLILEHGISSLRYFRKGRTTFTSMPGMADFRFDTNLDEPLLYVKLEAPFMIQSDRMVVRAEDEQKANELLDDFVRRYVPEEMAEREDPRFLMKRDEDQHLEFKSTLRYNMKTRERDPSLEEEVLKAICAFLNTEGGTLLVGVSDDKKVIGLEPDFQTFHERRNRDGFENHLVNLVWYHVGKVFLKFIDISFHEVEKKLVCKLKVRESDEPAFLKEGQDQMFYIRTGNNSRPLSMEDASRYIRKRWK